VGIAHQKQSAIVNEMVGNAHPTLSEPALELDKGFLPGSSIQYQ